MKKNQLSQGIKFAFSRNQEIEFNIFFENNEEEKLLFYEAITALMHKMGNNYEPKRCLLFIDASCKSLKAVLFYITNQYRSIPVAHFVHLKENVERMKLLLDSLKFKRHEWKICGELKVVGIILGLQEG